MSVTVSASNGRFSQEAILSGMDQYQRGLLTSTLHLPTVNVFPTPGGPAITLEIEPIKHTLNTSHVIK